MKTTDLRIGNYIMDAPIMGDEPLEVHVIFDSLVIHEETTIYRDEMRPIPLTEEWLLKFGFEQKTSSFVIYPVSIKKQTKNAFFYSPTSFHLKYVHQLQNIYFALTGEELTMNI